MVEVQEVYKISDDGKPLIGYLISSKNYYYRMVVAYEYGLKYSGPTTHGYIGEWKRTPQEAIDDFVDYQEHCIEEYGEDELEKFNHDCFQSVERAGQRFTQLKSEIEAKRKKMIEKLQDTIIRIKQQYGDLLQQ